MVEQSQQHFPIGRILWVLAIVAIIVAVWGTISRLHARSELKERTAADAEITVNVVSPDKSSAGDELVIPGITQAFIEAPIYARTSGYVRAWYTDIGAHVKKGQLLAEIETPEVDRQLSQAKADLATAQANLDLSETTNKRWQALLATNSVSRQDADEKAGDAAAKKASRDSADENVRRLNELEGFKRLYAPFDGVVTARNTDIGNLINAGQASGGELFRVSDTKKLRIYAQVPETYAYATTIGLKAEMHFPGHPGKPYDGVVVNSSHALDPTARTLQVELQLDNPNEEVLPGAYAEVHFKIPSAGESLRLPSNVVIFRSQGLQVATVTPQGEVKLKNIIQGRDFGKSIEVLDGLTDQDKVVVNPPDSIIDGLHVRIAPPAPPKDQGPGANQKPDPKKS
ncbi:MAG TPA: efflux RND transporter periplasmic adaptor subunit [Steroidobacteraceae bacterium]|jgi:RND family efflux transporter MFP subunit|nr:efflux RND transporter periplasmic adaptor subunit [Steroidobacteraceae bacterium]